MTYAPEQPDPAAIAGPAVLEFGANWCGICRAADSLIREGLGGAVLHLRVEDGPRRRLGRSFRVKLWPTLIFLCDGCEVGRIVRPTSSAEVAEALGKLDGCARM